MKSPSLHFIYILIILSIHGCKKDELSQNVKPITLEEAKDVFQKWSIKETDIGSSGILNPRNDSLENSGIYNKYPDWENATTGFDPFTGQQVMEVPIIQDSTYYYFLSAKDTSLIDTTNFIESRNKRSFIVLKNTDNSYSISVCNIIPDELFNLVNGDLDSNNYLVKTNNFSGLVIYTDWDDFILEAYDFENGECIGNAVFGMSNESPEENIMKIRWQVCGIRWICEYSCFCRPFKGVTTRNRLCPQGCDVTLVGCEYILVFCLPSNRGNFSGGSGNGNNNNGGTGNGTTGGSGTGNNSGGSARTPAQNVNAFEEECGNVNSFEEFETELNACHLISKGDYQKFKSCYIEFLINKGIVIQSTCLKSYYKDKFKLTEEEADDLLEDQECKKDPANKPIIDAFKNELASAIEDELRQLATDFPGVPFDVELFKSITSKIILKKTGKLIPLVGVGFDVVQLKAAYAAGDYLAMGLALGSLLTEIIPCAMIADLGITAASLGNSLFKTYKSLSELKTFLANNNSLFNAIFETIDELNLVDALELLQKWTINSVGQFKIVLGSQSIDDFLYALSQNLNKSWITESWGKSMDLPGGVRLNYIPRSTSGDYTTIEIIINGVKYKIRLD